MSTPVGGEIIADRHNGNGYWSFYGDPGSDIEHRLADVADYGFFEESAALLRVAKTDGSVLLEGAPGAGKSNVVRELQEGCVVNGVPCMSVTVHVNAGKANGIENLRAPLERFRDYTGEGQGLLILDNVDYLGYKGHSRTASAARRYAADASNYFTDLVQDSSLYVVGTAHTDEWRASRWGWNDPEIDVPAQRVLNSFEARMAFQGRVALIGLVEVMARREVPRGKAARVVRLLKQWGMADFFHANHVDADLFLDNPARALHEIEEGRQQRVGKRG